MRLLTNSNTEKWGLEMIQESGLNESQNVVFCVPIDKNEALNIKSIEELKKKLSGGISTKILRDGQTETILLELKNSFFSNNIEFHARIFDQTIRFYVSKLNSELENSNLSINHFYAGNNYKSNFYNTRLLILEPNLNDLDSLYLNHKVIFIDFY